MRIQYNGMFDAVHVADLNDQLAERGVPFEVADELGARLCEQPDWAEVSVPAALRRKGSRAGGDADATTAGGAGEEG